MEKVSLEQLVKITEGRLIQTGTTDWISGAAIDSRKIEENDLFIPIKGEKADGHCFIKIAAEKGCSTSFTETETLDFPEGISVVLVESCLEAMKALAKYNRCLLYTSRSSW